MVASSSSSSLCTLLVAIMAIAASTTCAFSSSSLPKSRSGRTSLAVATPPTDIDTTDTAASNNPGSRQSEYGKTLPLPETYVQCGRCKASFALTADDLGTVGKGCRVSCGLCGHSWFQGRDKLFNIREGFELTPYPERMVDLVKSNIEAGRRPNFTGVAKCYVGNLDFGVTEEDLAEIFAKVGDVGDVAIARDDRGRNRGFAFVTMLTKEGGEKALTLDGEMVEGRNMQVRPPNN